MVQTLVKNQSTQLDFIEKKPKRSNQEIIDELKTPTRPITRYKGITVQL